MRHHTRRMPFVLLAAIALPWLSPACELRFVLSPLPLPPLPAARPIEEFLPARTAPPSLCFRPKIPFAFVVCGGDLTELPGLAALGLIDLFGSAANFETALAAKRLEVAELRPRTDPFTPAVERAPATTLSSEDAALLRDWLTSDTSYLWGKDCEWPLAPAQGVRVTFYYAGKVVKMDLHLAEGVAIVTNSEAVSIVKLAPIPDDIELLIARALP